MPILPCPASASWGVGGADQGTWHGVDGIARPACAVETGFSALLGRLSAKVLLAVRYNGEMQVATACFNALGQPLPPLAISLARTFAFYIPLLLLGDYLWGYAGIFLAMAATNVLLGGLAWYWNRVAVRRGSAAGTAPA